MRKLLACACFVGSALCFSLAGCQKEDPVLKFQTGDIVRIRLTGERVQITGWYPHDWRVNNRKMYSVRRSNLAYASFNEFELMDDYEVEISE